MYDYWISKFYWLISYQAFARMLIVLRFMNVWMNIFLNVQFSMTWALIAQNFIACVLIAYDLIAYDLIGCDLITCDLIIFDIMISDWIISYLTICSLLPCQKSLESIALDLELCVYFISEWCVNKEIDLIFFNL